jgi:hypothetical protein
MRSPPKRKAPYRNPEKSSNNGFTSRWRNKTVLLFLSLMECPSFSRLRVQSLISSSYPPSDNFILRYLNLFCLGRFGLVQYSFQGPVLTVCLDFFLVTSRTVEGAMVIA